MHIVMVNAHVKPEYIEEFKAATLDNATNSVREPGVYRFDVFQQADEPGRFTLLEIYHSEEDPARHRETEHYNRWRDAVADMLVEPRSRTVYNQVFPPVVK